MAKTIVEIISTNKTAFKNRQVCNKNKTFFIFVCFMCCYMYARVYSNGV